LDRLPCVNPYCQCQSHGSSAAALARRGRSLTQTIKSHVAPGHRGVNFVLAFDDAHVLDAVDTDAGFSQSRLDVLHDVLSSLKEASIFVVLASANTRFKEIVYPGPRHPAWRAGPGWNFFPPLTEFALVDLHLKPPFFRPDRPLSLLDTCSPDFVTRLGRPQYVLSFCHTFCILLTKINVGGILCSRSHTPATLWKSA
jgi:hypothetical protein